MEIVCFINGNIAEIPKNSNGGNDIVYLISNGLAKIITCDESFRYHVDMGHCYINSDNALVMKNESEWPENQPVGGE